MKNIIQEEPNGRDAHSKVFGGGEPGTEFSFPLWEKPPSQHINMFTNLETPQIPSFRGFNGGLITEVQLIKSLAIHQLNSNSNLSESGAISSTLLLLGWFSW